MIVYLAHPVGNDVDNNVARATRWLHWLMAREPEHTITAPWLPYCAVFRLLGETGASDIGHPFRERVMRDNLAMVRRCHGVVLCGGRVAPGMDREADAALASDGYVWDLTHLGDEPPTDMEPTISPFAVVRRLVEGAPMPWRTP